jgi:hypothetical protein
MTAGAVIFAFNNQEIDYVKLASWSAKNINRHLDLPVCLVTDSDTVLEGFDKIIQVPTPNAGIRYFEDIKTTVEWKNTNRADVFELSPYDTTLLLDADYIIGSPELWHLMKESVTKDFLCFQSAYDLTGRIDGTMLNTFGQHNFPMSWATVMLFKRSNAAKMIFDSMKMIKQNWDHYRNIYKIDRSTYRNDFALSIALGIFSGHTNRVNFIPGSMPTVTPDVNLNKINNDEYIFTFEKNNKLGWLKVKNIDFHAMGKKNLEAMINGS